METIIELDDAQSLKIFTNSLIPEGGGIIWDAALVLTKFIAKMEHGFADYFISK